MAFYSMHAYDADVWIPEFRGLNQVDTGLNGDPRFAVEVENVETKDGVLQPQAEINVFDGPLADECPRVETLAKFTRRWYEGKGSKDWYVCCAGGVFYQKQAGDDTRSWFQIPLPEFQGEQTTFNSSLWSWITYEKNIDDVGTVDVLIMSNSQDGMIMILPPDKPTSWGDIKTQQTNTWQDLHDDYLWAADPDIPNSKGVMSPAWSIDIIDTRTDTDESSEDTYKNFAVIERFNERIFGVGVPDKPDSIFWSRAYEPDNWTLHPTIPEESAGENSLPSFDGDKFFALKRFGDRLLAFKRNKIWSIAGSDPGNYSFQEQYGKGTEFGNTIAVDGQRVYMTSRDGVMVFDGMNTSEYAHKQVEQIWKKVTVSALDQMCAVLFENRYYLAFPMNGSAVNNAMLVYNLEEGSILFYPDMNIEAFLPTDDILYATSSSLPGKILRLNYDSWEIGRTTGQHTKWMSPWIDFGYKTVQKGGFEIYFTPEVKGSPMTFRFSIQTEKKIKTKTVTVQTTTFKAKQKRIRFGGTGRRFRLIIETGSAPANTVWRFLGGIHMVVETDPD